MTGPPAAVAAVRVAVRAALLPYAGGGAPVLVACSGGADSLALAAAAAFVAPGLGLRAGLVTVDHGLQPGAGERARAVAARGRELGLEPADVATVDSTGPGGPEAAARAARYAALTAAAAAHGAAAVLLGHTRDDQAETVLLALARGAGPRGLAGMPAVRPYRGTDLVRPLLDLPRATARRACADLGLAPWEDPHNADPAYARSRVRATALPALVDALGERVVANLARSATMIAADNAALDALAAAALTDALTPDPAPPNHAPSGASVRAGAAGSGGVDPSGALRVSVLAGLPAAVRTRALHASALARGAPGGALAHRHVAAVDALVTNWRGQGPIDLPGGLRARRAGDLLHFDGPAAP
ncbi:tRNA(Ile)-lysidine synthase [Pilimelia anulata]|uniref:tRNA(Ile)-lysidine synthase n=1 Tax=Pilimelia anulata TaxID=53371 RepID=A0A8J3FAC9_9ACTN|nr:tRNA lysidine(34) synthetase TilS [Pilimelia anulata]GGJ97232.1 tRNA(Ile)-lysidine synthase [Pilimelia anulata]